MESKTVFFISPIGADESPERRNADQVMKYLVEKALPAGDYQIKRGDQDSNPGAITPTIITSILNADVVLVDMTGSNPNVFYELAIAHGYGKPTIQLQVATEKVPFDVQDMRTIRYVMTDPEKLEESQRRLREYVDFAITHPEELETPLSKAVKFERVTNSSDPVAESNELVLEALESLRRDVKRALSRRLPAAGGPRQADVDSYRKIISSVAKRFGFSEEDFDSVITKSTSHTFDEWVKDIYTSYVEPFADDTAVTGRTYDGEMLEELRREEAENESPF